MGKQLKGDIDIHNNPDKFDVVREYRKLLKENRALSKERDSLSKEVSSLKIKLLSAEARLEELRGSLTYQLGALLSHSRSPKALLRLPFRLLAFLKDYRKRQLKMLASAEESEARNGSLYIEDLRPDRERIWFAPFCTPSNSESIPFSIEGGILTATVPALDCAELLFSLPLSKEMEKEAIDNVRIEIVEAYDNREERVIIEGPVSGGSCYYEYNEAVPGCLSFSCRPRNKGSEVKINVSGWLYQGKAQIHMERLRPGISVVVPVYKAEERVRECLESIRKQSLSKSLFEVVLVFNGPKDGALITAAEFSENNPELNIVIEYTDFASAGNARNIGLKISKYDHIVFLDDDDYLTENYLEELYNSSNGDVVGVTRIEDVGSDGVRNGDNAINKQIVSAIDYRNCTMKDVSLALTVNACKSVPSFYLKKLRFDKEMRSGEDVHLFTLLFMIFSPKFSLLPAKNNAAYCRVIRQGSVSRQALGFDFSIVQRIKVIDSIDRAAPLAANKQRKMFALTKIDAQLGFIKRYLHENPEQFSDYVNSLPLRASNFSYSNQVALEFSDTLVISYCFTPYVDTAGIVMAKRIREGLRPVDVISNTMKGFREKEPELSLISNGFVGHHSIINSSPSFSSWSSIEEFSCAALREAQKNKSSGKSYKTIYSRALWVASHFAAALYKINNPGVRWVAEFSDPLLKDIHGKDRVSDLNLSWLKKNGFSSFMNDQGFAVPSSNNLFLWCERLAYALADEVVFTNKNQMKYMLGYLDDDPLAERVEDVATISPHPTLPACYYNVSTSEYALDDGKLNVGYFGSFYESRGLGEVLSLLSALDSKQRANVEFHVFTSTQDIIEKQIVALALDDVVTVNPYVGYFQFLDLCNKLDCLLVNDAETVGKKIVNPYLPSKYSDYTGSDACVWGICEPESVLFQKLSQDSSQGKKAFTSIIGDSLGHQNIFDEIYSMRFSNG